MIGERLIIDQRIVDNNESSIFFECVLDAGNKRVTLFLANIAIENMVKGAHEDIIDFIGYLEAIDAATHSFHILDVQLISYARYVLDMPIIGVDGVNMTDIANQSCETECEVARTTADVGNRVPFFQTNRFNNLAAFLPSFPSGIIEQDEVFIKTVPPLGRGTIQSLFFLQMVFSFNVPFQLSKVILRQKVVIIGHILV